MSHFLVTGGTGFIGSQVVRELVSRGNQVTVYDALPMPVRLGEAAVKVRVVKGDILDLEEIVAALQQEPADYIIHLAYFRDMVEQDQHPAKAVRMNILGFANVMEAARITGIRRVAWASSVAVYGPPHRYGDAAHLNETAPHFPVTLYGACKSFNEYLGKHYATVLGVPNVGLRPAIVYGEGRWFRGYSNYAYDLFVNAALGKAVKIDHGNRRVDWLYVKDLARAFLLACEEPAPRQYAYNVNGISATVADMADVVRRLVPDAHIEVTPGDGEPWPADLDGRAALEDLGYAPEYGLEHGARDYIAAIRTAAAEGNRTSMNPLLCHPNE